MLKIIPFLALLLLFGTAPIVNAKDKDKSVGHPQVQNQQSQNNKEEKDDDNQNAFEIKGEITSVSGNSFVVLGQTIVIDPSQVEEFKQKGILQTGDKVQVEGTVKDGTNFAEEVKTIGTGQGRFKLEFENTSFTSATSSSATGSGNLPDHVKIKAQGPIDQVVSFLKQILSFLTSNS